MGIRVEGVSGFRLRYGKLRSGWGKNSPSLAANDVVPPFYDLRGIFPLILTVLNRDYNRAMKDLV